jgi:hypothetical protein
MSDAPYLLIGRPTLQAVGNGLADICDLKPFSLQPIRAHAANKGIPPNNGGYKP